MKEVTSIAGYEFKNVLLLRTALTHSSYANENKCVCNERLEFLGDSVLGLAVSRFLYKNLSEESEGILSKIRASLVCEEALAVIAKRLEIGKILRLGRGEDLSGGRNRNSILSDAFEAIIAAICLDSDFETAENWILAQMQNELREGMKGKFYHDYKTMLQEVVQKRNHGVITYRIVKESGPDHDKHFVVEALRNGKFLNCGEGTNKKEAEQNAAKIALEKMGEI